MKNKKLFAILTLVCFMMTLMPVAAFAADGYTVQDAKVVVNTLENFVQVDATTGSVYSVSENGTLELVDTVPAEVSVAGKYVVISGTAPTTLPANAKTVTVTENDLNRVAADAAYDHSSIMTVERNVSTEKLTDVAIKLLVQNKYNDLVKTNELYVWATQGTSKVPATALLMEGANISPVTTGNEGNAKVVEGVYKVTGDIETTATGDEAFFVQFASAGTYTIHASFDAPTFENGKIADAKELTTADATKTIEVTAASVASKDYRAIVTLPAGHDYDLYEDVTEATPKDFVNGETVVKDGNILKTVYVEANNVAEEEIVLKLVARDGVSALPYKDLKISTAGAVEVSDETVTTDRLGEASFKISGNREGTYKVYVTSGQFEFVIEVQVGATGAVEIECTDEPENPIDILGEKDLNKVIEFTMYDVNGNELKVGDSEAQGWNKADNSNSTTKIGGKDVTGYVAVIAQPAGSKIKNEDLRFDGTSIVSDRAFTVEGVYEFKVVLNNGNYATAKMEVKEFTTPVELVVEYPATVELGAAVALDDLYWVDANKVEKKAYGSAGVKVNLAATGYAVESFDDVHGKLVVKGDEKYVGAEITVTAVDERYNLIDTAVIKVANGASKLAFATKTAEVKVNNKIRVNVVDEDGNVVALGNKYDAAGNKIDNAKVDISYVILDKPEGAKVFASTTDEKKVFTDGYFTMNLTSNTVGNVTVQAVLKYTAPKAGNQTANVVKYYTGTQIFAVGNGSAGDVVVMSVGSNEIVINDKKAAIDAAPIVKNDRTFVPFRALAEAFGIKVIPTYDENGATADILFNL